jgi:peptidoglycan/xylan/chitin deacetylase (PgdA/CDA1 family)
VMVAPHTHTHPILTHIPIEKARDEIRTSRDLIKQHIGQPLPVFAYPDGRDHAVSKELGLMLQEEGIQMAFTMSDRISRLKQDDPQLFPRLTPYFDSLPQFHLRLTAMRAAQN